MTTPVLKAPQVPDFALSPELQQFRAFVRDYATSSLGDAAAIDAEVKFPRAQVDRKSVV